jgi:hypothetical protein
MGRRGGVLYQYVRCPKAGFYLNLRKKKTVNEQEENVGEPQARSKEVKTYDFYGKEVH